MVNPLNSLNNDQKSSTNPGIRLKIFVTVYYTLVNYLNSLNSYSSRSIEEEKRSLEDGDDRLDDLLLSRVQRFLRDHQFKVQLPEFLFQEATLTFRPAKGLDFDVSFPAAPQGEERAFTEGRNSSRYRLDGFVVANDVSNKTGQLFNYV